jgi:hypothetical protein
MGFTDRVREKCNRCRNFFHHLIVVVSRSGSGKLFFSRYGTPAVRDFFIRNSPVGNGHRKAALIRIGRDILQVMRLPSPADLTKRYWHSIMSVPWGLHYTDVEYSAGRIFRPLVGFVTSLSFKLYLHVSLCD